MKTIYAKVQTKSNYKGLNGEWLLVHQFLGKLVAVKVLDEVTGKMITTDFNVKEVVEFKEENN